MAALTRANPQHLNGAEQTALIEFYFKKSPSKTTLLAIDIFTKEDYEAENLGDEYEAPEIDGVDDLKPGEKCEALIDRRVNEYVLVAYFSNEHGPLFQNGYFFSLSDLLSGRVVANVVKGNFSLKIEKK